jgi:hypothetical protein
MALKLGGTIEDSLITDINSANLLRRKFIAI